jgi:tetratricopeptide (TPR) repeat protein
MIRTRCAVRSNFVVLTALLAPILVPAGAFAADPSPAAAPAAPTTSAPVDDAADPYKVEARQRYDRGIRLYAEGEFALAVIEFERAYTLVPDYRVLYNIGQVRIQLAQYARARKSLEQYLAEGGDQVAAERKASVQADLEMLASRTATLDIKTNVPDAEIVVNDSIIGRSPLKEPILLDAGEHRITLRKPGYSPQFSQITLAGRDSEALVLNLEKVPEAKVSQIVIDRSKPEPSNRSTWLWATWSATGVFAIGAGVTGALGIKSANELEDLQTDPTASRGKLDDARSRAKTLLLAADILGAAAIVTGGTALYLTLSSPKTEKAPAPGTPPPTASGSLRLLLKPNFVGLRGTY